MRVYFDQRKKFRLFRASQLEVVVSVLFTELEQAVIKQHGLKNRIAMHRPPTVYTDYNGNDREIDNNIYLSKILKHAHVEPLPSPHHAAAFEAEFMEFIEALKNHLTQCAQPVQSKVYDL